MAQNSLIIKIHKESARTAHSGPPIFIIDADIQHDEPIQAATALDTSAKISLKERLDKLPLRLYSDTCPFPRSVKTCPEKRSSDVSQPLQCGEKKEKMWLSDVYTRVESLSRNMEKEKYKVKPSICKENLLQIPTIKCKRNSWLPQNDHGREYQDWRGVILLDGTIPYTMLSEEEHQERLKRITKMKRSKGMLLPQNTKMGKRLQEALKRRTQPYRKRAFSIQHEKVKRIGPHLDIFEAFKPFRRVPTFKKTIAAVTCIQKIIRGWLDRTRWNRIKVKAKSHGTNLLTVVREFRRMMHRIKRRCGILDPTTPLVLEQLEDWLDNKTLYETMFARREFWKEMDRNELPKFFRDCGRFPSPEELNIAMNLVIEGPDMKIISINKNQAVEIAFMLYPPLGLKLRTAAISKSTWVKPIVDGEDAYKLLVSGHPLLKTASLRVAAKLVAESMRERKMKNQESLPSFSFIDFD